MKVCVFGLWHLGSVTAACLAAAGHDVTGLEPHAGVVDALQRGEPPLYEPGLETLTRIGIGSGRLSFTTDPSKIRQSEVVWVTYDTPVDEDDRADAAYVVSRIESLFPHLGEGTLVVISSQLPVGTVAALERSYAASGPSHAVSFLSSPENLRLGKAIDLFTKPDRVVAGARTDRDRARFAALMAPITTNIEWMSVESAEMTKHALNAFLAASVTFINEIATLCEGVGADAKEVERGLKSDVRIGPRAYLSPGAAFAGGTLARDVAFLNSIRPLPLLGSIKESNDRHKGWAQERLRAALGTLGGRKICVWGLTYKPGTDTLRRSAAVELCRWLAGQEARVAAYDPAVKTLPDDLRGVIALQPSAHDAAAGADAVVVATEWPEIRESAAAALPPGSIVVIDANRFLPPAAIEREGVRYFSVGRAWP